jgi:hypothetical protein
MFGKEREEAGEAEAVEAAAATFGPNNVSRFFKYSGRLFSDILYKY